MKMKQACAATNLTERAIRLYLKKDLLSPGHTDKIIDFSGEDIQRLNDIALLRQMDFTIEQISCMIHSPSEIPDILHLRMDSARIGAAHEQEVLCALSELNPECLDSIHSFASRIRQHRAAIPKLDFGRFDETNDAIRRQEKLVVFEQLSKMERQEKLKKQVFISCCICAVMIVLALLFFSYPRIQGFISIGPISVAEVHDAETATFIINNEQASGIIGTNTLNVPYRIYREPFEPGTVFESGCQLAIELTNYDLSRMGINPLQALRTKSAAVNNEWTKFILHTLFEKGPGDNAVLWIHEPCNLLPLIWSEQ